MTQIEDFLKSIQGQLRLGQLQRSFLNDELRDHLEARIEDLEEEGLTRPRAEQQALIEFGDAASFAQQFQPFLAMQRKKRWMMRFATMAIVGSFVMLIVGYAIWPEHARIAPPAQSVAQEEGSTSEPDRPHAQRSETASRNTVTYQKLEQPAGKAFQFDDDVLADVIGQLKEAYGITIVLTQSAELDQLQADTLVTSRFNASEVSLKTSLELMLADHNATFIIRDGLVHFISRDVVDDVEYFDRAIIDAAAQLRKIEQHDPRRFATSPPSAGIQVLVGGPVGGEALGGFSRGGGVFNIPDPNQGLGSAGVTSAPVELMRELKTDASEDHQIVLRGPVTVRQTQSATPESTLQDLIQNSVDPDTWQDTGHGSSTISIVGGQVVVLAPRTTIEKVQDFIKDMDFAMAQN